MDRLNMNKLKSMLAFSILALSACNNGGGGNSNPTTVVPGVKQQNYPSGNGGCNVTGNTYQCTENGVSGPVVTFSTQLEFCQKVQSDTSMIGIQARQFILTDQCRGVTTAVGLNNGLINGGFNNGLLSQNLNNGCHVGTVLQNSMCVSANGQTSLPNQGLNTLDSKILSCRVSATTSDGWSGDSYPMQVPVSANIPTSLYAGLGRSNSYFYGFFNTYRLSSTNRLANISVQLVTGAGQADSVLLKVETKGDNRLVATASGFAGSVTGLNVTDDAGLAISVECSSVTAVNLVKVNNPVKYKCSGQESAPQKPAELYAMKDINQSWEDDEVSLSKSTSIQTSGSVFSTGSTVRISHNSSSLSGLSVSSVSNLTVPSTLTVSSKDSNYKMNLTCRPAL